MFVFMCDHPGPESSNLAGAGSQLRYHDCEYIVTTEVHLGMKQAKIFMTFATLCDFGSYTLIEWKRATVEVRNTPIRLCSRLHKRFFV
jgi:hypothetical protein